MMNVPFSSRSLLQSSSANDSQNFRGFVEKALNTIFCICTKADKSVSRDPLDEQGRTLIENRDAPSKELLTEGDL